MNDLYEKSLEFAKKVVNTNKDEYARRNQTNTDLIVKQIADGKYCEYIVELDLKKDFTIINGVDVEVYDKQRKSFDADIIVECSDWTQNHYHVKSITRKSANRFGVSWMFQKQDTITTTPKKEDILALCIIEPNGEVDFSYYFADEVTGLYRPPKLERLIKTKTCLYLEDLP